MIANTFEWVGIDIEGPLPKASRIHIHVFLVMDYATRYPEAIALHSTNAPVLARELATIFSWVGFPLKILMDQGTNFMGWVMQQLWELEIIQPVCMYTYHPQTNSLVECFNGT